MSTAPFFKLILAGTTPLALFSKTILQLTDDSDDLGTYI